MFNTLVIICFNCRFQSLTHIILFRYGWFSSLESTCSEACLGSADVNGFTTTSEVTPDLMKELERTSEDTENPNHLGDAADAIVPDQCMDVFDNHLVTPDLNLFVFYFI